jgi:hypothetical protein
MTDEELKNLVAETSRTVAENSRGIAEFRVGQNKVMAELRTSREEQRLTIEGFEKRHEAAEKRHEAAEKRHETAEKRHETAEKRHDELWEEILASRQETDRLITSLERRFDDIRQEVGGIANRTGLTTEAMFLPSLERILRQDFGMTAVDPRISRAQDGDTIEIDVIAHGGADSDTVYVVEVKTHLREAGLHQILNNLRRFPKFFPEHRGKKVFGILGGMDAPRELRKRIQDAGLYLATIRDDVFEVVRTEGFEPEAFPA